MTIPTYRIRFQHTTSTGVAPTLNVQEPEYQSFPTTHVTNRTRSHTEGQAPQATGNPSLVLALVKTFGWEFSVAGFYKIFQDLLLFASPQILK